MRVLAISSAAVPTRVALGSVVPHRRIFKAEAAEAWELHTPLPHQIGNGIVRLCK